MQQPPTLQQQYQLQLQHPVKEIGDGNVFAELSKSAIELVVKRIALYRKMSDQFQVCPLGKML